VNKLTRTPKKPSPRTAGTVRPTTLDAADLSKIGGGCTNENLTNAVIK
jgi:hypothetical protein